MIEHYEIPLLNDYHNHTSFYMALRNCLDVRNVKDIDTAIEMIKTLKEDINIVLGWSFGNTKRNEIEKLAPVLICDGSLHNYIMNQKAKDILVENFPVIVKNIEDLNWIEHNLYSIIKFIPQIKTIEEKDVYEFFDFMLKENQIYSMEDLLLPNTDFIEMYENAGLSNRLKYWVDINSYNKLPDQYRNKIEGFKHILTEEYLKRNNPFRMLIDECGFIPGKDLIFGSDGMPHGAQSALENSLFPVYESQKLTLDEFVKGYCVNSYDHGEINFDIEDKKILNLKTVI